jgi:hypothetical protein
MADIARAGSQRWLQISVNRRPELIDVPLQELIGADHLIEWLSPLEEDEYREYRDGAALRLLGIDHLEQRPLSGFWPARGPVWDALGRTSKGDLLLVEAKAHIPELVSGSTKAEGDSLELIASTMNEVRRALAPRSTVDWTKTFYQYTNRLAFLHLLRNLNGLPAHLVHVYFVNASDMGGPGTVEEWSGALRLLRATIGLGDRHPLEPFVHEVFVDVRALETVATG